MHGFGANLSKPSGTPVRVDLWCFAYLLHIHLYFVGGHRRMLATQGNRYPKSTHEWGFLRYPSRNILATSLTPSIV